MVVRHILSGIPSFRLAGKYSLFPKRGDCCCSRGCFCVVVSVVAVLLGFSFVVIGVRVDVSACQPEIPNGTKRRPWRAGAPTALRFVLASMTPHVQCVTCRLAPYIGTSSEYRVAVEIAHSTEDPVGSGA